MSTNSNMLDVSQTAQRLASGYYAFLVAQLVAANPDSINSLPPAKALGADPTGEIKRKDGTAHVLNLRHYLDLFREDHSVQREVLRTWAIGALLTLGDELSAHDYFDRAPELELVYHLRNGVAHGNRFNITDRGRRRLAGHPAHNRSAAVKSPIGSVYEITPMVRFHIGNAGELVGQHGEVVGDDRVVFFVRPLGAAYRVLGHWDEVGHRSELSSRLTA